MSAEQIANGFEDSQWLGIADSDCTKHNTYNLLHKQLGKGIKPKFKFSTAVWLDRTRAGQVLKYVAHSLSGIVISDAVTYKLPSFGCFVIMRAGKGVSVLLSNLFSSHYAGKRRSQSTPAKDGHSAAVYSSGSD